MTGTALVTGASAGIGRALAREFARRGHDVVLVARREERLRDLADAVESDHGVAATVLPADLTQPDASERLWAAVDERGLDVETLVNNVGVGVHGRFGQTDPDAERRQLRLNVSVLVELTHRFLGERDGGNVLNVGSMAGFTPGAFMAGYYASKAYVNSFSQSLAAEHRDTDVDVTVVCPGPVDTGFQERAGMSDSAVGAVFSHTPEEVARAAYDGLATGETVVVPGAMMRAGYYLLRVLPQSVKRAASRYVNGGR